MTRRLLFKCRLFVFLASNGKRFVEILAVEPRFVPHVFQQALFPNPRGLDIEFALQLPINRLDPLAGDSPLSAHPVDVAMQGHSVRSFQEKRLSPQAKTKIPGRTAFATAKASRLDKTANYFSRSTTFAPPI